MLGLIMKNVIGVHISLGDALDRLSILSVKLSHFSDDPHKQQVLSDMINTFTDCLRESGHDLSNNLDYMSCLTKINYSLWDYEDAIRLSIKKGQDYETAYIAKRIVVMNDRRAKIKIFIDKKNSSPIYDFKIYRK